MRQIKLVSVHFGSIVKCFRIDTIKKKNSKFGMVQFPFIHICTLVYIKDKKKKNTKFRQNANSILEMKRKRSKQN